MGIDELKEGRVLRLADGRVTFDHDLYADWVRARQLMDIHERGQLSSFLATRLGSPVWHRAVRLFGVHLLEQSDDLSLWRSAFEAAQKISTPASILAQDILLESTVFSSASGASLFRDGLWPLLAERGGRLLERLLNRLFHTATIPNPAVLEVIARQAPELEIHAAAGARLPYPFYWFGILSLLHAHREEVPPHVRGVTARVADQWLRSTPREWPFRKESAALAVALGEAMLKGKEENDCLFLKEEADQQVYRAVLASGHEEPDAVSQIVLEASGRQKKRYSLPPLSEEEIAAYRARYRESAVWSLAPSGPLPDPWPHGPAFRVDGSLQKTVLEGDALQPLTEALPQVAREVLLALLISEPERRSFNDDPYHDRLALERPRWYPTFYNQGPFRSFLATAQPEATTAILQLVDHATDRWAESHRRYLVRIRELSPSEVETPTLPIQVDEQERDYIGDADVFRWCQHGPDSGGVIGATLAALEKHLYDRVDAGEDVTPLIQRLLTESRSLAIVGLLSVFGRRHLHYLRGPLRGLLVSPYILAWTLMDSVSSSSTWEIALSAVPKPLREEYRAWHELPHRKTSLRDFALFLFLNDTSLRPLFRKARKVLLRGLQPGGPYENWSFVENLVAQLDSSNYSKFKGEDGRSYKQYSPPEELRKKHAEMDEGLEAKSLLMMLPFECRQLLDSAEPTPEETLDRLWASAQKISQLDPDVIGDVSPPVNALAGVAAVLIQRGGLWLSGYPERLEWSQHTICEVGQEDGQASAVHAFQWDRRAFAAETLPILWSNDPDDKAIREIVGRLALHTSPEFVGAITVAAAKVRERLGDDHLRLLRAILIRAGLEPRIQRMEDRVSWDTSWNEVGPAPGGPQAELAEDAHALRSKLEAVERAFVERTLKAAVPSLEEVAPLQPLSEQRATRHPHRRRARYRFIEESLLTAAYRGVPNTGADKDLWLPVWERIVLETVEPLVPLDDKQTEDLDDLEDLPGLWGQYIMARVADVVATTEDSAIARRLWQPIIDLGATASQWVSLFVRYWAAYALFRDAREPIVDFWMAMIDTALANPRWIAGEGYTAVSHRSGELWRALFGFGNFGADVWTNELRLRASLLRSRLATWVKSHLANSDNVCALARFLTYPAATNLLLEGVSWLDSAFQTFGDRFWGTPGQSNHAEDAVLSLLAHIWCVAHDALRRNEPAFKAFRNLLQALVSRQHPAALELADRVGSQSLK